MFTPLLTFIRRHPRGQQAVRASPVGPLLSPALAKKYEPWGGTPPPSANWAQSAWWHLPRTKIITMTTCTTTTSQKAVSMGPRRSLGRPKLIFYDLGIDFGLILGSFFHQNFDIIRKWRKCEISEEYNAKRASEPSKTFDFRIDFSSTFVVFSKHLPKRCFSAFKPPEGAKKSPY